jgi:type II secretion system protein D
MRRPEPLATLPACVAAVLALASAGPGAPAAELPRVKPIRAAASPATGDNKAAPVEQAVVRLNYISTDWSKVLAELAEATGAQLLVYDTPPGRYSRQDWKRYTPSEAIRILNRELEPQGFRILAKDKFLTVIDLRRARAEYRPPVYGDGDGAAAETGEPAAAAGPRTRAPAATTRNVSPASATTSRKGSDRLVRRAGYEEEAAQETAASPTGSKVLRPLHRDAADLARQLFDAFRARAEQIDAGPHGLPAFRVHRAPVDALPRSNDRPEPWFVLELDTQNGELHVTAADATADAVARLFQRLDKPAGSTGQTARLVAAEGNLGAVAAELAPQLERLQAARRELARNDPDQAASRRLDAAGTVPARQSIARPFPEREALTWNNPAQVAQQSDAAAQDVAPGQETAPAAPESQQRPLQPGSPDFLPELIGRLRGDVTVQSLPDLDLLILTGNQRDVDQVLQVIRIIEEMALGSAPGIHFQPLKHVDSEALAALLTDVYTRISALRGRSGTTAAQTGTMVDAVAVTQPNAVLILSPENMLKDVLTLVEELDQPVDPKTEVEVFRLRHAVASQVVTQLTTFYQTRPGLGTTLRVIGDPRTNSVIVQARPNELSEVRTYIRQVDRPNTSAVSQVRVIQLKYAVADELAQFLMSAVQGAIAPAQVTGQQGQIGAPGVGAAQVAQELRDAKSVVLEFLALDGTTQRLVRSGLLSDIRITANINTNSLMITAPAESLLLLEELVRILDQPAAQVAEIKVFTLKNADANTAVQLLQDLFSTGQQQGQGFGANQQGAAQLGIQIAGAEGASSGLIPLRFSVDPRTNSVVAIGGGETLRVVQAILLRLDTSDVRNRQTTVLHLRNSPATEIANAINTFLQSQRQLLQIDPQGTSLIEVLEQEVIVTPEPVRNNLLISATPRYFDEILRIAEELDKEPAQVVIQALLLEVELNDTDEFGVELGFQDSILFDRSVTEAPITINETTTLPNGTQTTTQQVLSITGVPGFLFNNNPLGNNLGVNSGQVGTQGLSNFALGRVNDELGFGGLVLSASSESVSVLIRALSSRRNVRILSRPQVTALDNQLAQVQVGQQVPVVTGVNIGTTGQANPIVTPDDAGIILTVTPRISPEGQIVMQVAAEKSQFLLDGVPIFVDATTGNTVTSPIKNITTALTTVKVPDGQTIVIGGMITKSDEEAHAGVPWLMDVPILGNLFRYDSRTMRRTELLIFLTPRIVHGDADMELIKQVEADRMHYFEEEAESIHGPLFGVPPAMLPPPAGTAVPGPGLSTPPSPELDGAVPLPPPPGSEGPAARNERPAIMRLGRR